MNSLKSNWLSSVLILAAGIALICLYSNERTLNVIVYIIGALFTATGCINIVSVSLRHSHDGSNLATTVIGWIAGLGGIGLGAAMLITPESFHAILVYVFAVALVLAALWHFFCLISVYRRYGLPGWLYVAPVLLLAGGIIIFCSTSVRQNTSIAILITGIGCLIYAVTTLLEYILAKESEHEDRRLEEGKDKDKDADDMTATVVDENHTPAETEEHDDSAKPTPEQEAPATTD